MAKGYKGCQYKRGTGTYLLTRVTSCSSLCHYILICTHVMWGLVTDGLSWNHGTHTKKKDAKKRIKQRGLRKRARVGCNSDCTFEICFVLSVFFSQSTRTHTYTHTRSHGQIKPNGSHFVCYMKPVNHWMLSHLNKLSFFASCWLSVYMYVYN